MGIHAAVFFNCIVGFILLITNIKVISGMETDQVRLISDLLKNYDPDARPVKNASEKVTVIFTLAYNQLQKLDEPAQILDSRVWILLIWNDAFLRWNTSDYGGFSSLNLKPSRIWTPDLELFDSTKRDKAHISSEKSRIIVYPDGTVAWSIKQILHSSCRIDVAQFPFDTQKCQIKFASWTYDERALNLQLSDKDGIYLDYHQENTEWKLKSISSERRPVKFKCCPTEYVYLIYTVEFERKSLYYVMTIIVPSMLLSLLACISFLFPADSGERVSLVISVMLGLVVFMLIVNDRTPVSSDSVPMMIELFNSIAATAVVALLATAFILHLNHVSSGVAVPPYLANVRDCIAVVLCMKKGQRAKRVDLNFEDILMSESPTQYINMRDFVGQSPAGRKPLTEQRILLELQKLTRHLEEENSANEMKEDWHYTMRVFDRLFFAIFFICFWVFAGYFFSFI